MLEDQGRSGESPSDWSVGRTTTGHTYTTTVATRRPWDPCQIRIVPGHCPPAPGLASSRILVGEDGLMEPVTKNWRFVSVGCDSEPLTSAA